MQGIASEGNSNIPTFYTEGTHFESEMWYWLSSQDVFSYFLSR
jgi:hypothetical protein